MQTHDLARILWVALAVLGCDGGGEPPPDAEDDWLSPVAVEEVDRGAKPIEEAADCPPDECAVLCFIVDEGGPDVDASGERGFVGHTVATSTQEHWLCHADLDAGPSTALCDPTSTSVCLSL